MFAIVFAFGCCTTQSYAVTATTTTLAISATNVPYKTPITLTATVTAGGSPVSSGFVTFCDATAAFCENNSPTLSRVQVSTSGAAVVRIGSGPMGNHSYKAVYSANNTFGASTSNTVSYVVQGTYPSQVAIGSSGTVGNYNLASTVSGVGAFTSPGPSGTVTYIDTSAGNTVLGTAQLGPPVLTDTFSQAPNSPFPIADGSSNGTRSLVVASSYLDTDNNIDVVTGDGTQTVTVLLGKGDGSFKPKVTYPGCPTLSSHTDDSAVQIQLADFNRDGHIDIALGCSDGQNGGVAILLGNGDGTFGAASWNPTGDLGGLALGDFNGDGILDLVVTSKTQQNVQILRGNGDGTFQAPVNVINTPKSARNIIVADLNGDGKDDLAYVVATATKNSTLSDLYVALGNGNGTFQTATLQASGIGEFLTVGDTNNDNKSDLVSATVTLTGDPQTPHITQSLFVLIGNGDGTFQTPVAYWSDIPSDPHLADVNGDGKADIIAGGSTGALVYVGNGDGTFQAYQEPVIGGFALTYAVNAGDYNNDGNADLIGTDAQSEHAAVALSDVKQASDASTLTGVAVFPLGSGVHQVDASYSGDSIYLPSVSSTVPLTAAPAPTTLTLSVAPSTAVANGQSVTLTATLSPWTVGPPTTTTNGEQVKFYNGSTQIGTGTLSGGVATFTTTSLPSGTDPIKAVYPGDSNYLTSTSSTISVTVSSVVLSSSPNPSTYGQTVTLVATVASGSTGTVTFKDGSTTLGTATISGTTATMTIATLTVGSHSLTAVYGGDGTHSAATSAVVTQVVNKATPTVNLTSSVNPSTYGQSVTFTATVPSGATGTVTFNNGLGTVTISGGVATATTSSLPVGTDSITATYNGDGNYNTANASLNQVVNKATPTMNLTSSVNPSTVGQSVTFTATVASGATGTVTFSNGLGTVTISGGTASVSTSSLPVGTTVITATYNGDSNNNTASASLNQVVNKATPTLNLTSSMNPSTVGQSVTFTATVSLGATGTVTFSNGLGTVTISGGTASVSTSSLPVGTTAITATYNGDSNNNTASASLNQVVNKANPTISLASSVNPSTAGQSVTFTATVPSGATGTVTFTNGATNLGTATISGTTASVTTSTLPSGTDTITATYNGDSNNNTATASLNQVVNKANPTISLASSANPSTVGQSVTFTVTVPSGATGTVTFANGATPLGTATISGATASVSTSSLPLGTDTITATYNGDSNNNTATATLNQVVNKATPTMTVSSSPNPSTFGQSVTITATVPGGATGTVTFSNGATVLGTSTLNGSGVATVSTSALPVGPDTITASYAGDSNNNAATGSTTQVVNKVTPTVTVSSSPNPSNVGQTVTITATVPPGATGTVMFTAGATPLGTATVNSGTASVTTTSLPVGSTTITASYSGDSNYNAGTATTTQVVGKVTPTIDLVSSLNPASVGTAVMFTATVSGNATGTVTFANGATVIGTGTISGGKASVTTSTLPLGSDTITATYSGDTNNNTASASMVETINQNATTVTVSSSPNPSTFGQSVTITATVPSGATGTVNFTTNGTPLGTATVSGGTASVTTSTLPVGTDPITASYSGDTNNSAGTGSTTQTVNKTTPSVTVTSSPDPSTSGQTVTITVTVPPGSTGTVTVTSGGTTIGVVPVTSSGTETVTTSTLPVGTDTITATYSGDTNNNPATGTTTQVVGKSTPTVTLTSSANPSNPGQTVIFTATVPAAATGSITFTDGATVLGTATITSGAASISVSTLTAGTHPITATYSGDGAYNSGSATLSQVVNKTVTTVTLTSSANPSNPGQSVTFTATVPSAATGTVTFADGGTALGTGTVTNGVATYTTSTLTTGTHPITATYSGDGAYNSGSANLSQVVGKSTPTVTVTSSQNPSTPGESVTITATVPTGATGTVTFTDNGNPIGTVPVNNGTASITTTTLPTGTDTIVATYSGDNSYNSGTGSLTQTVNKNPSTVTVTSSSNPSSYGQTVTITATVPTGATGTVTFTDNGTPIGTVPVNNGTASVTTTTLPTGSDTIVATYSGDNAYNSGTGSLTQTVNKIAPTVTLTSSSNPSTAGQPVTFTATVPTGATGTVTFTSGSTVLGTATVTNGVASVTTSSLPSGSQTITATYSGDSNYGSGTASLTQTVGGTTPTVTLTSSVNPSTPGQSVTFTATVGSGVTGTVTFKDGTTVLGTGTVNSGVATYTTSTLSVGTHPITASYGGDTTHNPATSAILNQVVGKLPTTTTLAASVTTVPLNGGVTLTATVSSTAPTPTGTVTFMEGTTVLGSTPMNTNGGVVGFQLTGSAALQLSNLTGGTHTITAVYSGDANFLPSTSAPITLLVHDFTNKNTGPATASIFPGDSTTFKFTLTPVGTTTFPADVNLALTGLPDGTQYTLTPTKVASGLGATEVTVSLKTSSSLHAGNRMPSRPGSHEGTSIAMAVLGLAGLGAVRRYRRKMPRLLVALLLLAGSLLPVASLTGCAGGYFALKPTPYTVTLTGAEGTLQHSATATLDVQ